MQHRHMHLWRRSETKMKTVVPRTFVRHEIRGLQYLSERNCAEFFSNTPKCNLLLVPLCCATLLCYGGEGGGDTPKSLNKCLN